MPKSKQLTEHFNFDELKCPCCGVLQLDQPFVKLMEKVRRDYGKPMVVNSFYRCDSHNRELGARSTSSHRLGLACDVKCDASGDRYLLVRCLLKYFSRLGLGENFIHFDCDPDKMSGIWTYY